MFKYDKVTIMMENRLSICNFLYEVILELYFRTGLFQLINNSIKKGV